MWQDCKQKSESMTLWDGSGPNRPECGMLQVLAPSSTFQIGTEIPQMANMDRYAGLDLVKRCLSESEQAWKDFYDEYDPLIRMEVRRHSRFARPEEREDLVQEVYKSLVEALSRYDGRSSSLRTFVSIVAQRTCIDCWRGRSRRKRSGNTESIEHHDKTNPGHALVESRVEPPDKQLEQSEYANLLRISLTHLSESCQRLLRLRYFSELTHKEIGEETGQKENSVTVAIRRCLERLRAAFDNLEHEGLRP